MPDKEAREDILAAIAFYDKRGACWLSAVTFIGINACFGGWSELVHSLRVPHWSSTAARTAREAKRKREK